MQHIGIQGREAQRRGMMLPGAMVAMVLVAMNLWLYGCQKAVAEPPTAETANDKLAISAPETQVQPASEGPADPAASPTSTSEAQVRALLAEAATQHASLFDDAELAARGAKLAQTLRKAILLGGQGDHALEARYRLAVVLLEWFTYCRLAAGLTDMDLEELAGLVEPWEALLDASANGGQGRVDVQSMIKDALSAGRAIDKGSSTGRSAGRQTRGGDLETEDEPSQRTRFEKSRVRALRTSLSSTGIKSIMATFMQSIGTLLAPVVAMPAGWAKRESRVTLRHKAQAALVYLHLVTQLDDEMGFNDPKLLEFTASKDGFTNLVSFIESSKSHGFQDEAWLLLRMDIDQRFGAIPDVSGRWFDLITSYMFLTDDPKEIITRLKESYAARNTLVRGTWTGISSPFLAIARLGSELGPAFDPKWSIPERFIRWWNAIGYWQVNTLESLARPDDLSRGGGSALRMLTQLCKNHGKAKDLANPRCLFRLTKDDKNMRKLAVDFADSYQGAAALDKGYRKALQIAAVKRDEPESLAEKLGVLEAAARRRHRLVAWSDTELPLVARHFRSHLQFELRLRDYETHQPEELRDRFGQSVRIGIYRGRLVFEAGRTKVTLMTLAFDRIGTCLDGTKVGCLEELAREALAKAPAPKDIKWQTARQFKTRKRRQHKRIKSSAPKTSAAEGPTTAPAQPERAWIKKISERHLEIKRSDLEEELSDTSQIWRQVRLIPHYQRGEMRGLKVIGVRRGSLFRDLGLKSGDVVLSIAGEDLTNPNQAVKLIGQFKVKGNLTIKLLRRSQKIAYRYDFK